MLIFLEVVLLLLPGVTMLSLLNRKITAIQAGVITGLGFVVVFGEILVGSLFAFDVETVKVTYRSLVIGKEWWHILAGPIFIMWYLFIFTEISIISSRRHKEDHSKSQV
ncbi:hypothetical protein G3U99_12695 [Vibrio coralliilyticus OCN008]|uniref:hypothetical protein n=1 Tax=Vibrio coralliilyticus TaxID=190893 RepID=UPI0003917419|nr:hypothetical protein [Vibrio coralliilyticus]ERB65521.1 hypothetical protein N779_09385 [Vibrio coralliilyticus OCN008]QIJ85062.1 hypothetical protein G3U99_12695 [Vibrio coralliilyticus OCN008]